jgi:hypothetical protein
VYKTNWRGAPGAGSVSTVDGLQPGGDGDVALHAVRTVSQSLSASEKTQARTNIGLDDTSIETIVHGVVDGDIDALESDVSELENNVAELENKFQTGTASVAVESDAVATQTVTFPKAFASTPAVVVCLNTNASAVLKGGSCAPSGISANGFTINAYRPTVGNVPVRWISFVP